MCTTQQLKLQK
jgi:hypothetical protein